MPFHKSRSCLNLIINELTLTRNIKIEAKKDSGLTTIEAVIFDFIGTVIHVTGFDLEKSKLKLYKSLVKAGFDVAEKDFLNAYNESYEESRLKRYSELVEVSDAVWVAQALSRLGFETDREDIRVKTGVAVFFQDYLNSLELNQCAEQLLSRISKQYKTGLVSNFTYAPIIYAALRKLKINKFFNAVLVSEDVGWRKPSKIIFQEALRRLDVNADNTVYVGDCPSEDIGGASAIGMKTIFVPSQFYSLEDFTEGMQRPDLIVKNMCELRKIISVFIKNLQENP
jgi:putative hydrolase of the HAD superfamily